MGLGGERASRAKKWRGGRRVSIGWGGVTGGPKPLLGGSNTSKNESRAGTQADDGTQHTKVVRCPETFWVPQRRDQHGRMLAFDIISEKIWNLWAGFRKPKTNAGHPLLVRSLRLSPQGKAEDWVPLATLAAFIIQYCISIQFSTDKRGVFQTIDRQNIVRWNPSQPPTSITPHPNR